MTRNEFMDSLQKALARSLTSSTVNENMRYYEEYFDTQIRSGRDEEEITASLGDPRLLAKTIIDAAKYQAQNHGGYAPEYDEIYEDGTESGKQGRENRGRQVHSYRIPGWLLLIFGILVLLMVVGIIGSVVSVLLPILLPVLCILMVVRWFQRRG